MTDSNLTEEDLTNPFYNVRDVALLLKLREATIRKWFLEGRFEGAVNPGGKGWLVRRSAVIAYVQKEYGSNG
jgi:hypothetical protein